MEKNKTKIIDAWIEDLCDAHGVEYGLKVGCPSKKLERLGLEPGDRVQILVEVKPKTK